jgi:hypothetical protein
MGDCDLVVGPLTLEAVVRETGKGLREAYACHVWRVDAEGRVDGMRHPADTHAHGLALQS